MKGYVMCSACIVALAGSHDVQAAADSADAPATTASTPGSSAVDGEGIADIVVTAQRRSERMQDVPIAITAASAERLAMVGIQSAGDLAQVTPGLSMPETAGTLQPHIRGVGTSSSGPGVENPVALYIDGVYIASGSSSLLTLNNIERIEVLKGPQGTLFGRNATGGLIQVITKDPAHTLSGQAEVSYANFNTVTANGYLTGGLTDTLAADIAVRYERQGDGWGHNFYNGAAIEKIDHDVSARSRFLFEPGEGTKLQLALDYADRVGSMGTQHDDPGYPLSFNNPFFGGPYNLGGVYDVNKNIDEESRLRTGGASLTINQDFGALALQSTSAYRESSFFFNLDLDVTPVQLISCCGMVRAKQISQEFQLSSNSSGPLKWVSGMYLFYAKDGYDPLDIVLSGPVSPVPGADFDINDHDWQRTRSAAAYVQGSYDFGEGTTLTLGGRFTYEGKRFYGTEAIIIGGVNTGGQPLPLASTGIPAEVDYKRFNYRVALDHKFAPGIMGYVSYTTGFKSGGYNLSASTNPPYAPEGIKAAEVGLKTEFLDQHVRLNVAAYHYDYSQLQVSQFVGGTEVVGNGAAAKIDGVDFDTEIAFGGGFSLTGGASYIHDRFTEYPNDAVFSGFDGCAAPPGSFCSASGVGNHLGQTPKFSFNAGGDYKTHLANGSTLGLNLNYAWSAKWYASPDNYAYQPSYGLLNSSILWTDPSGRWSARLWGRNLTNEVYAVFIGEANQGVIRTLGAPRTYGLTAGYKF